VSSNVTTVVPTVLKLTWYLQSVYFKSMVLMVHIDLHGAVGVEFVACAGLHHFVELFVGHEPGENVTKLVFFVTDIAEK
jgi:hypothetical protein